MVDTDIAIREDFELPAAVEVERKLAQVHSFQQLVHRSLINNHDYGTIPGTQKPTLLKPGAEKINKLLGLAATYDVIESVEDWDRPLFHYVVRCRLVEIRTGSVVEEGMGECNSMESRYRWRWMFARDLENMGYTQEQRHQLPQRQGTGRNGQPYTQYRLDNDDIYSLVNTILKMAKKRALVDAALSVGRLSDLFTQDLEDMPRQTASAPRQERPGTQDQTNVTTDTTSANVAYWCADHQTNWFKSRDMRNYAHPIKGTNQWCNMPQPEAPSSGGEQRKEPPTTTGPRDVNTVTNATTFKRYMDAAGISLPSSETVLAYKEQEGLTWPQVAAYYEMRWREAQEQNIANMHDEGQQLMSDLDEDEVRI